MARKKKVEEVAPEVVNVKTVGDGSIDPYASGVSLANPEPNNGNTLGQTVITEEQNVSTLDLPTTPEGEQDEVAEGREEQVSIEK